MTVNLLMKIVHYKQFKIIMDTTSPAKVIIEIIMKHYSLSNFSIKNKSTLFILKFLLSLYYFLGIK